MADERQKAGEYIDLTLDMIKKEIDYILTSSDVDPHFYEKYANSVEICDEQIFAKKKNLTPNRIYIVVKFGTASFDFGQALLPITLNAVSEQNSVDVCQKLLFDLATNFTQQPPIDGTEFASTDYVKQLWNTPNVINNFNEVNIGFRSLMYMTGTLLVGHNSSPIVELIYNKDATDGSMVELHKYMITFSDSFDVYPDTQAFYTTHGIGKTAAKTASYAFSITLFKVSNPFMNKCRAIKRGNVDPNEGGFEEGISSKFSISMLDKDDIEVDPATGDETKHYFTKEYTLINMTIQQNKGDLPTVALTFAR